jgi:hypothetical protein
MGNVNIGFITDFGKIVSLDNRNIASVCLHTNTPMLPVGLEPVVQVHTRLRPGTAVIH